jgi:hypothetical protein
MNARDAGPVPDAAGADRNVRHARRPCGRRACLPGPVQRVLPPTLPAFPGPRCIQSRAPKGLLARFQLCPNPGAIRFCSGPKAGVPVFDCSVCRHLDGWSIFFSSQVLRYSVVQVPPSLRTSGPAFRSASFSLSLPTRLYPVLWGLNTVGGVRPASSSARSERATRLTPRQRRSRCRTRWSDPHPDGLRRRDEGRDREHGPRRAGYVQEVGPILAGWR